MVVLVKGQEIINNLIKKMEKEEKKCDESSCCGMGHMKMGMCGRCCHGGKHSLIRIILMLIIVMMIFCFGFKLGKITGSIGGGDDWGRGYGRDFRMMRGFNYYNNGLDDQRITPLQEPSGAPATNPTPKKQ